MSKKIILKAQDLDGYLDSEDKKYLSYMENLYSEASEIFKQIENRENKKPCIKDEQQLTAIYGKMSDILAEIASGTQRVKIYSFKTPASAHGEVSRIVSKLRDVNTQQYEFIYYTQRAYELLFNLAIYSEDTKHHRCLLIKTPVTEPVQNYAIHKIPYLDEMLEKTVMCVMLRGALLPSLILSKEIQEYSKDNYITPFELFRIKRDETKLENNMEYVLDLDHSYFDLKQLDGKDLIFADPMNATGGSFVTVVRYILSQGIKPKSIKFFNIIASLKGTLRILRAVPNVTVYTLWLDPMLNEKAYILPGLGDAGDRLNGQDKSSSGKFRDIKELLDDYGPVACQLYKDQFEKIRETVSSINHQ